MKVIERVREGKNEKNSLQKDYFKAHLESHDPKVVKTNFLAELKEEEMNNSLSVILINSETNKQNNKNSIFERDEKLIFPKCFTASTKFKRGSSQSPISFTSSKLKNNRSYAEGKAKKEVYLKKWKRKFMKKMSEVRQQMEKNATPDEGLSKQTELVQDEKNGGESVEKNKFPTSLERICLSPVVNHVFHNFSIQKVLNKEELSLNSGKSSRNINLKEAQPRGKLDHFPNLHINANLDINFEKGRASVDSLKQTKQDSDTQTPQVFQSCQTDFLKKYRTSFKKHLVVINDPNSQNPTNLKEENKATEETIHPLLPKRNRKNLLFTESNLQNLPSKSESLYSQALNQNYHKDLSYQMQHIQHRPLPPQDKDKDKDKGNKLLSNPKRPRIGILLNSTNQLAQEEIRVILKEKLNSQRKNIPKPLPLENMNHEFYENQYSERRLGSAYLKMPIYPPAPKFPSHTNQFNYLQPKPKSLSNTRLKNIQIHDLSPYASLNYNDYHKVNVSALVNVSKSYQTYSSVLKKNRDHFAIKSVNPEHSIANNSVNGTISLNENIRSKKGGYAKINGKTSLEELTDSDDEIIYKTAFVSEHTSPLVLDKGEKLTCNAFINKKALTRKEKFSEGQTPKPGKNTQKSNSIQKLTNLYSVRKSITSRKGKKLLNMTSELSNTPNLIAPFCPQLKNTQIPPLRRKIFSKYVKN